MVFKVSDLSNQGFVPGITPESSRTTHRREHYWGTSWLTCYQTFQSWRAWWGAWIHWSITRLSDRSGWHLNGSEAMRCWVFQTFPKNIYIGSQILRKEKRSVALMICSLKRDTDLVGSRFLSLFLTAILFHRGRWLPKNRPFVSSSILFPSAATPSASSAPGCAFFDFARSPSPGHWHANISSAIVNEPKPSVPSIIDRFLLRRLPVVPV